MTSIKSWPPTVYLRPSIPNLYRLSSLKHDKCPIKSLLTITSACNKISRECRQARTPSDRQTPAQFILHLADFGHQLLASLSLALCDCVHG